MASILVGHDKMLAEWAAKRIPHIGSAENFGKFVAVGVATGMDASDKLLAVVIYNEFYPQYGHCQISIASASPKWVSKATLRALLSVPFEQYKCNKVWVSCPHTAERTIDLAKALGFTREASLKDHYGRGTAAVVLRMMWYEYEKKYWPNNTRAKAA